VNLGTKSRQKMNSHPFEQFPLGEPILRAVTENGYQQPTPVQVAVIPEVLAGRDLLATAQTGTGKTAAFALPILDMFHAKPARGDGRIRARILTPTRELALQVPSEPANIWPLYSIENCGGPGRSLPALTD
jgi:ATP-dependent RNA helicase RhlE